MLKSFHVQTGVDSSSQNVLTSPGVHGNVFDDELPNEFSSTYSSFANHGISNISTLSFAYSDLMDSTDHTHSNELIKSWHMNYHEAAIYLEVISIIYI